jgi:hypothetical protein
MPSAVSRGPAEAGLEPLGVLGAVGAGDDAGAPPAGAATATVLPRGGQITPSHSRSLHL